MVREEDLTGLSQYIQKVLQTSPAPPEGSNVKAVLDAALQMTETLRALIPYQGTSVGGVNLGVDLDTNYKQLRDQVELADKQWQQQSGRAVTPKPTDPPTLAGSLSALASAVKWAAILVGLYYGGKIALDIWNERKR